MTALVDVLICEFALLLYFGGCSKLYQNKRGSFSSLGKLMVFTAIMTLQERWKQIFVSANFYLW